MGETRYKALLIGNAQFDRDSQNLPALKGPPEDLKLLERALTDPQLGLHAPQDVRTLLDATNSEIREAIDDFFNTALPYDQLLFYYSGHGRQDANNGLYLCARDTRTDRLASTAVGDTTINQIIQTSHSARTLIVLDCCHSGSFKGGGMPPALTESSGRFLLTSCRNQQLASDATATGGPSAFTACLVEAMVSGEVDTNHDGFITLTEAYQHILPKLKLATQQIPQLYLDKTIGDLPLGRARAKSVEAPPVSGPAQGYPRIEVSDTKIELLEVRIGEKLSPVVIDVFNLGDGELDWTASTDDAWIQLEPGPKSFKIRLNPVESGPHRGNIYVRDSGRGGSRRISVFAEVLEPTKVPVLYVAQTSLDFGKLRVGAKAMAQLIPLANKGGGELRVRAQSANPALRLTVDDDAISVEPDLSREGSLAGEIVVSSAGGRAVVQVAGKVEIGPVLHINPGRTLDFGKVPIGETPVSSFTIENSGEGALAWEYQKNGDFFAAGKAAGDRLEVRLTGRTPGAHLGTVIIKSNGGEATLNVRAEMGVAQPPVLPPPPPPFPMIDLSGWWQTPNGRIFINGMYPSFQYADYNAFGAMVGNGTLALNGNQVFAQGAALMIPYTARLVVNSPMMMSGMVYCMGAQSPVVYTRC